MRAVGLAGLARSWVISYLVPFRQRRMRRFYDQFLAPGDLCFDVGAHLGNRIRTFLTLGARVVAMEPQQSCLPVLHRLYGAHPQVTIIPAAAGARPGEATLRVCEASPTLSSLSGDWVQTVEKVSSFRGIHWEREYTVEVRTLDDVIREHGVPRFLKIDVEGFEADVLRGLTHPIEFLSFEYLPAALEVARNCIGQLEGSYRFNISRGESMRMLWPDWRDAAAVRATLDTLSPVDASGDVYARLL